MRVILKPGGCWRVVDVSTSGYGQLLVTGRQWLAHRVAYTLFVGPIPPGHVVHHSCGLRACVNPAHLVLMSRRAHAQHHLPQRSTCKRGHSMADAITPDGRGRQCRTCRNATQRATRAKRKAR